ncbi:hypothetical protein [Pseudanabaena sp. FACHB-2040]|uniref:hypothetical protein n=1 Tax=Pseudanabaena sp. FACHB-2040 TaxID=2692859 RepID=UPI0016853EBB|nr:hypothetical protein [Pseudanabaena sp. FACHB-2040]
MPGRGGAWQPPYGSASPSPPIATSLAGQQRILQQQNASFSRPPTGPRPLSQAAPGAGYSVQAGYGNAAGGTNSAYQPGAAYKPNAVRAAQQALQQQNASFRRPPTSPRPLPHSAAGPGYSVQAPYSNAAGGLNTAYSPGATYRGAQSAVNAARASTPNAAAAAATAAATAAASKGAGGIAAVGVGALAAPFTAIVAAAAGAAILSQQQSPQAKNANWAALPQSYKEAAGQAWGSPAYKNPDGSITYLPPFSPHPVGGPNQVGLGPYAAAAAAAAAIASLAAASQIDAGSIAGGAATNAAPPFTGGQSPGIPYRVVWKCPGEIVFSNGFKFTGGVTDPKVVNLTGPLRIGFSGATAGIFFGTSTPQSFYNFGVDKTPPGADPSIDPEPQILSTSRLDGLADIGGDPAGELIAPSAPPTLTQRLANPTALQSGLAPIPTIDLPGLKSPIKSIPEPTPERQTEPLPAESLPAGHPLSSPPPTIDPVMPPVPPVAPDGTPTQTPAPLATPENVPAPIEKYTLNTGTTVEQKVNADGSISTRIVSDPSTPPQLPLKQSPFAIPPLPLVIPLAPSGLKIDNPTKAGSFTAAPPTTPPAWIPPVPPEVSCRCNGPVLNGQSAIQQNQNALDKKLDDINTAGNGGNAAILAAIAEMRTFVGTMQTFAETAWKATKMDKVINLLTLVSVLHNASMLSRDIAETLGYAIDNALQAAGVPIKDEQGNQISVTEAVGGSVQNFVKGILGEDVYNGLRAAYLKANRIVQTASMVIWTIRSIQDSALDLTEWIAENTGKIGNALKRFGVVGERAYPWMSENPQARNRFRSRFDKLTGNLERAEDFASSFATGTSNVLELTQEVGELGENWQAFQKSVIDFKEEPWPDNKPIQEEAALAAAGAQSPPISPADTERGS